MSRVRTFLARLVTLPLLLSPVVSAGTEKQVGGELKWLQAADPRADFANDVAEGRLQFVSITGYSLITPGLLPMRYFMCYSQRAGNKIINTGGCVVYGDEDLQIYERAYKYSEAYNQLLVTHLDRLGFNDCGRRVDWDAAWAAVNEWAGNIGPGNRGTVALGHEHLRLYLNNFADREHAAATVCDLLRAHKLDREFTIEVSPREDINTARENDRMFKLSCTPRPEP